MKGIYPEDGGCTDFHEKAKSRNNGTSSVSIGLLMEVESFSVAEVAHHRRGKTRF